MQTILTHAALLCLLHGEQPLHSPQFWVLTLNLDPPIRLQLHIPLLFLLLFFQGTLLSCGT